MSDPVIISVFVVVTTCFCCVEFALAAVERYYNLIVTSSRLGLVQNRFDLFVVTGKFRCVERRGIFCSSNTFIDYQ